MSEPTVRDCPPSDGFDGCVSVSVFVRAAPERLYKLVTDIENLSALWPDYEFRRDGSGPLRAGGLYYSRQKGHSVWVPYSVKVLEPNRRVVGELVKGDRLFARLRYDHRFAVHDDGVLSQETVQYRLRYGILGRIADRLLVRRIIRKQVLDAHLRLKRKAEEDEPKGG
jgi:hypothetical protein